MASKLRTTIPESEARFVRSDADEAVTHATSDANSRTMWREWTQIKASVAKSLSNTLMGVAQITGPTVDGETYTGVYSNADVIVIENNRRWVTIRQKLIRLTTVLVAADLPQPVDVGASPLLRPFQYDPGSADDRVFEYRYLNRSSSTVCLDPVSGISNTDLALSGYTILDRRWRTEPRGDRTCTFFTIQRKVIWSNIDTSDRKDVSTIRTIGEEGYYAGVNYLKYLQSQNEMAYGVPIDDAANILAQWHSDEAPATSGYATSNVAIQVRGDGEVYISRTREPVNPASTVLATAMATGFLIEREMFSGGGIPQRCVVLLPNLLKTTADALLVALRTASTITLDSTVYRNDRVRRNVHPSGLCDLIITGKIATVGNVLNEYQDGTVKNYGQKIVVVDDGTRYRVTAQRIVDASEAEVIKFMNAESPYNGAALPNGVNLAALVRPPKNNLKQHLDGHMEYSPKMDRYIGIRLVWTNAEPGVGTFKVAPSVGA